LANNSKEDRERDAVKARAQYQAEGQAIRDRTAQLRSLRLAKEAAELASGVKKKNAATRKDKKEPGTRKAKSVPLSAWLTAQQGAGRRS
jgi:hypothetical protein